MLAAGILRLLDRRFAYEAADAPRIRAVFVSYAHEDRYWLTKLRSVLRPLEHTVELSVWDDQSMRPGASFEREIADAIAAARVAIILVSDAFLRSAFIRDKELPWLLARHDAGAITIFWLPVEGEAWRNSPLAQVLVATEKVEVPLTSLPSAMQQDALVKVRNQVAKVLASDPHLNDRGAA
jgi:hypothetical protein